MSARPDLLGLLPFADVADPDPNALPFADDFAARLDDDLERPLWLHDGCRIDPATGGCIDRECRTP